MHCQTKFKCIFIYSILLYFILSTFAYALSPILQKRWQQGLDYLDKGQYQEAISIFNEVLNQDPKAVYVYNDLGMAYVKMGDMDKAMAQWLKALSIDPSFLLARYNLIKAYIDNKEYDKAISHLRIVIKQDPKQEKAYNTLGVIYWTLGRYDLAEAQFKKAISLKPDYKIAYLNLARIYIENAITQYKELYKLSPKDKAIKEEYKRALQVNKKSATNHFLLGQLYQEEGKTDLAISEYRLAASLDKRYGASFFMKKAQGLRVEGQIEKAAQAYEIALALDPQIKEAYYGLGEIYYLLKKFEKAVPLLKKAITLMPKNAYGHHYLALTYYQLGKYDLAISEFKKALALSNDYQIHYGLALAYEALGKYELARAEYNKVIALCPEVAEQIRKHMTLLKPILPPDIMAFIKKWSHAWENRDFKTYADCYSQRFYTNGIDLKKWLDWKKLLFTTRFNIKVEIKDPRFKKKGNLVVVCFRQDYKDNKHQDQGQKCLYLENEGGWHIVKEEWKPLELSNNAQVLGH